MGALYDSISFQTNLQEPGHTQNRPGSTEPSSQSEAFPCTVHSPQTLGGGGENGG